VQASFLSGHRLVLSPVGIALRFGARSHRHCLNALPQEAIGIRHHKSSLILGVGLQIQNAACKHVGRDDVKHTLVLVDSFALQTQQWQPLLPQRFAVFAVGHVHLCITIVVALNEPFKSEIDQCRMVDDKLARLDSVTIFRGASAIAKAKQAQKGQSNKANRGVGICILHVNPQQTESPHCRYNLKRIVPLKRFVIKRLESSLLGYCFPEFDVEAGFTVYMSQ